MATKTKLGAFGGMQHTAGIFSDMTVDGPTIGTLVAIIDRAKNLPNRRSMGKQDPYCAARLGKEAKKTATDKRGGQTPRWDQELRFTVHDSVDYQSLKVSVFNDDKKTELIGETWVSLEDILLPGGGQSDSWHGLNCKGKYAGEIRIELTYYDSRPKEKAAVVKKKEVARTENGSPAVGGPRESTPVKRRPLPSDPTGASPSPSTPDQRGLSGPQAGPRAYPTPPAQRSSEHIPQGRRSQQDIQSQRRPFPEASPMGGTPVSNHTPQHQSRSSRAEYDGHSPSPHPSESNGHIPQYGEEGFDMSYTAPKPYEVQPIDALPQHMAEYGNRTVSNDDFRRSHGHSQSHSQSHVDLPHSYSAPVIPTQHAYEHSDEHGHPQFTDYPPAQDSYPVEPLRMSRNGHHSQEQISPHDPYQASGGYMDSQSSYDPYASHRRSSSAMQPSVEDEDDVPPPPPVHRSSATAVMQHPQQPPPSYHGDAPAPLNIARYREEPSRLEYDSPPQPYDVNDYSEPRASERRYTHPRASPHPTSRPESRDTMAPSPLRNETALIPSSLVPGFSSSRQDNRMSVRVDNQDAGSYQTPPSYETPQRMRQYSEPDYRAPPQYETPPRPHPLAHHQSMPMTESPNYYPHAAPQEPRHTSPTHDPTPIIKPRAVSPGNTHSPADNRASRPPVRSMPTRKSVSPRPPPSGIDPGERSMSGVPFNPDSFDVYNPTVAKKTPSGANGKSNDDRRSSAVEVNEKGQVVTFNGRVIDASDHLPLDSWAPEPEPKGVQKDRPARERPALSGARDLEAAKQRERDYRKERLERERIRNAVNAVHGDAEGPSNALVTSRHYSSNSGSPMNAGTVVLHEQESTPPGAGGRNRLQKRNQRPVSAFVPTTNSSPSNIPMPNTQVLRERENLGGYGSSPGYGADNRRSIAAPPIPAKVPLDAHRGYGGGNEDMTALSLELQSIDIGPGGGGRQRGTARRRYGDY